MSSPPTGRPTPRRSHGPIFLPANYKLLSDVAIKELKKHNATTRSTPPPKRAVNTHDTDPHPEQPPTDTPTGDPTPPESPALNGSRTTVMTNPSMWEGNKLSTSLMAILPLSNVGQVSCI